MDPHWLNVPNCITLFRFALVPVFVWLYLVEDPEWALGCFTVAAISDGLDGFFARLLNQRTKLGAILDPIADNLLVILGAGMVKWKNLEIPTSPSRIGKYATFTLICLVVLALVTSSERAPRALDAYVPVLAFISALCVVISTIQYFARFGYLWFEPARPR